MRRHGGLAAAAMAAAGAMVAAASVPLFLAGCGGAGVASPGGGPGVDPGAAPAPTSARERLATPHAFALATGVSNALTLRVGTSATSVAVAHAVAVLDGSGVVHAEADGALVVDALDGAFDDVTLGPDEVPPDGLVMTGLSLRLDDPALAMAHWDDAGAEAWAEPTATLVLEWAALTADGTLVPLMPQTLAVPVALHVWGGEDGLLRTDLSGYLDGTFWSWGELVQMSDLAFDLHGVEVDPPAAE
jgi:hypothetical protein